MGNMSKLITVKIKPITRTRLKILAARANMSMLEYLDELIKRETEKWQELEHDN